MKAYIFMDLKFNGCSRWLMTVILIFISLAGYAQAPVITSFSPASAKPGDAVTLTGTGFNTTTTNNIVFFGATRATVTAATATSVTVTVPTGATYAPITLLNTGTVLACASLSPFHPVYSPAKAGISSSDISGKVDFNTDRQPLGVKIGDLDGDGKPDLVFANMNDNTVTVFRNNSSSGSVSYSASSYTTGTSPHDVAIGDLDGDGKPDLAVANAGSANVSMFRNTSSSGSVSFAAAINYGTGTNPYYLAIGNVDGDGKPDVAVVNASSSTVSVLRNTASSGNIASGSFATKVDFTMGTNPYSVAIGDLGGDGKPDLAVANRNSNTVSVLRNTASSGSIASGSLATKVDFTTGTKPSSVAIGDLDGDGRPDLAVGNYSAHTVSVLRNTDCSSTSFTNPTSGGGIAASQTISPSDDPAAFTSSAAASGHSGTLEY